MHELFTNKKLFVFLIVLGCFRAQVSAEVLISEIMYDPKGPDEAKEWVEIHNSGPDTVTIITGGSNSSWKFSDKLQHSLALIRGSAVLAPGDRAIIADNTLKFVKDWPSFSGTIFDSSISLNNLLGELSILSSKNGKVLNQATYYSSLGANGDGNSLQLQEGGTWIASMPTPGARNSSVVIQDLSNSRRPFEEASAHYGSISLSPGVPQITIALGAGRERIGAVGSPMEFKAETGTTNENKKSFIWNMGDGTEKGGSVISHTYKYPGEYVVILSASFREGDAIARLNVNIVDPQLNIPYADKEKIEVKNNSQYEVNMFGRALVWGGKFFVFPKDTILRSGQNLSFVSTVTALYPQNSSEVFIAVLGDAEHSQFQAKIEEARLKQISNIKVQIENLRKNMEELFPTKINLVGSRY